METNLNSTEELWRLMEKRLRSFIFKRVSNRQVADDLLQDTFVRVLKKKDEIDEVKSVSSWVTQIARNLIIDHYRSRAKQDKTIADDLQQEEDETQNSNEVVASWLPRMISQLPEPYREAVELYELQGFSQQEIASRLGLSLSGAKSRIQRGREKLKSILIECCSFEQDRRGNLIGYQKNNAETKCKESCDCE